MATREEILMTLEKAHKAGDEFGAKESIKMLQSGSFGVPSLDGDFSQSEEPAGDGQV